jgi:hypothetical protein
MERREKRLARGAFCSKKPWDKKNDRTDKPQAKCDIAPDKMRPKITFLSLRAYSKLMLRDP